ncbi:MAG TPA: A24 family peptidase [Vicinamibacterales bacterium]
MAAIAIGVAAAVVIDVRTRRIPNWLTGALAGAGFGIAFGGGAVTPMQAALGLLVGLAVMLPMHVLGATGPGDVKLVAAIGSLVGPARGLRVGLYTAVAGGAIALIVAARRGLLVDTFMGASQLVTAPAGAREIVTAPSRGNQFAYAPAVAVGTFVALVVG